VGEEVALLLVVNVIVQTGYVRFSAETLGRFGLSDRSRRILETIDDQITFTCVYTAAQDGKEPEEYRGRLLELLEEMEEFRPDKIRVKNVTKEGAKARLRARLAREREQKHAAHLAFVRAFQQSADDLRNALNQDTAPLLMSDQGGYLDQWRLRGTIGQNVSEITEDIQTTHNRIDRHLKGGVIEYGEVVGDANDVVQQAETLVEDIRHLLRQTSEVPAAVRETAPNAVAAVDAAVAVSKKIPAALIDPNTASVEEMKKSFIALAETYQSTAEACNQAADALEKVGGELFTLVYRSDAWVIWRMGIAEYYQRLAMNLQQAAARYRRGAEVLSNADELRVILRNAGRDAQSLLAAIAEGKDALQSAIRALTNVDDRTGALFEAARQKRLMAETTAILERLNELSEDLAEPDDSLADELAGENILLMEVGEKSMIVPFDEVWPTVLDANRRDKDQPILRRFNGDSAITSALLGLVREPFAKVYLTHFMPPVSPRMHPMMQPRSSLPPEALTELQERLEQANFEVETWNLTDPAPWKDPNAPDANSPTTAPDENAGTLPRLLVICPPASSPMPGMGRMPQFGPEHVEKIKREIDRGTGAIFLTHFHVPRQMSPYARPQSPPYPLDDYLNTEWGIDPLNEFIVFPATRDPQEPERLTPNLQWFAHMPINAYTDHPIGKPLQGRRTLWTLACPVVATETAPNSVSTSPLLRVPRAMDTTWASKHFLELVRQFRSAEQSAVTPRFDDGDMPPPFPVAMAATRSGADQVADARVVVLGVAMGLRDGHLSEPVLKMTEGGGSKLTDPPSANADVIINSCLWLTGWDQYIASGPARIEPIEMIDPTARGILWAVYVAAIPAVVLVIGALVMSIRRRQ
jgi:hypothetical protein